MNIALSHGDALVIEYGTEKLIVSAGITKLRVQRTVASAQIPPFDEDPDVVRVRLGVRGTGKLYAYRCPGAKVGDLVRTGVNAYHYVEALGTGGYTGPLARAELVAASR